jgi:hypothetical protein
MPVVLILLYVALSALIGWFGRNRIIHFAGFFALSLLLTPFIMGLVLLVSGPRHVCPPHPDPSKLPDPAKTPESLVVDA